MFTILNKDHHPKSQFFGAFSSSFTIEKHIFPEKTLLASSCCSASSSMGTLPSPAASCRVMDIAQDPGLLGFSRFPWVFEMMYLCGCWNFQGFIEPPRNNKKQLLLYNLYIQAGGLKRDPYNGVLQSPHDWIVQSPTLNNQVFFIAQFIQETFVQSLNLTHHTCVSSTGTSSAWPCSE